MKNLLKPLCIACYVFVFSHSIYAQDGNYTSLTLKKSVWSSSSYIGDLSDWVYFGDGSAKVIEYRAPESSFSFTAAIRENEDGSNELESLVGATRIGNAFIKLETGGAEGQLFNPDNLEPLILPENKTFQAQLNMFAIGTTSEKFPGLKYGFAWVNLIQPAEIELTYYTVSADAGFVGAPTWAESAVDPEFSNHIMGFWFDIDSLSSFMKGEGTFYSSPSINGRLITGFALDWELVWGLYFSEPSLDLDPVLKEAYGLNYEYVESTGLAWTNSYKLAYNIVYRADETLAFGMQIGIEGRAIQTLLEFPEDKTISSRDQVIGKIGIGDNDSYQWGPYVRFAMEF